MKLSISFTYTRLTPSKCSWCNSK